MFYAHRDENGQMRCLTNQPNGSTERLADDHPDIVAFLNRPRPEPISDAELILRALRKKGIEITPDDLEEARKSA